jgi:hypothetical protein
MSKTYSDHKNFFWTGKIGYCIIFPLIAVQQSCTGRKPKKEKERAL